MPGNLRRRLDGNLKSKNGVARAECGFTLRNEPVRSCCEERRRALGRGLEKGKAGEKRNCGEKGTWAANLPGFECMRAGQWAEGESRECLQGPCGHWHPVAGLAAAKEIAPQCACANGGAACTVRAGARRQAGGNPCACQAEEAQSSRAMRTAGDASTSAPPSSAFDLEPSNGLDPDQPCQRGSATPSLEPVYTQSRSGHATGEEMGVCGHTFQRSHRLVTRLATHPPLGRQRRVSGGQTRKRNRRPLPGSNYPSASKHRAGSLIPCITLSKPAPPWPLRSAFPKA
jgi:hypothetical protein